MSMSMPLSTVHVHVRVSYHNVKKGGPHELGGHQSPSPSQNTLYKEPILPALSPCNITHYNDTDRIHYSEDPKDSDISL